MNIARIISANIVTHINELNLITYSIDTTASVPDFGVNRAIMLPSRNFPYVVQVGLRALARKR